MTDIPEETKLRARIRQLETEVKGLEEERVFDKRIIKELHVQVERLEAHRLPDAHLLARRIHEALYDRGSAPGNETWLLAPADWRSTLLRLIRNYYCF